MVDVESIKENRKDGGVGASEANERIHVSVYRKEEKKVIVNNFTILGGKEEEKDSYLEFDPENSLEGEE